MGERIQEVISSFYMNVLGFPKGFSTPREKANVFGCVIRLSDLGVLPFTGPKLETISKMLVALKRPRYKFLYSKIQWE